MYFWNFAPKENFCSSTEIELSMQISTRALNSGSLQTFEKMINVNELKLISCSVFCQIDITRIRYVDSQSSKSRKTKRKQIRHNKNKLVDKNTHSETLTIQS